MDEPPARLTNNFVSPTWTFLEAAAWITWRTREAVELAGLGGGEIARDAVEALIKALIEGRLTAWSTQDGRATAIPPERWRSIEINLARMWFVGDYAGDFGQLVVNFAEADKQAFDTVTLLAEAVRRIFPAEQPAVGTATKQERNTQEGAQRQRAKVALRALFPNGVPPVSQLSNRMLSRKVSDWLRSNHRPLWRASEVSLDTVLRASGRRVDRK